MRAMPIAEPLRTIPAPLVALLAFLPLVAGIESARVLLPVTPTASPATLVAIALAASAACVLVEAGFWRAFWSARGARAPFAALAFVLWALTAIEALASAALAHVRPGGPAALWLAPWVGYRALGGLDALASGWRLAFANAGLLTAARIAASAWAQARLVGRHWREALTGVVLVWLASHVAMAWIFELARGRALGPR